MKIALYTTPHDPSVDGFIKLLESENLEYALNPSTTVGCDFAVSFGGDGTFLSGVRKMKENHIPIMGINSGRLGFLSTVSRDQAREAIVQLIEKKWSLEKRTMLRVETNSFPEDISPVAVNEFSIQKSGTTMISININIDGLKVGTYWADGIIVSTPTGSTAYSMSVGGAILTPGCRTLIISPIAPHNLNIRPLVVSDSSVIKLRVETRHESGHAIATVDNRECSVESGSEFILRRSDSELEVVQLHGSNFYKTIREKLLWGVDPRN